MPRVFQPVPNVVEATVQGNYMGQLIENKFYAKAAGAVTAVMVAEIADIVDDWVTSTLLANLPSNFSYVRTIARDLSAAASFEVVDATGAGPGTNAGAGLASNVSLAVHRQTNFSGTKQKSRIYYPVMLGGFLTDVDHVAAASGAAITTMYDTLRGNIMAGITTVWDYGYPQRVIAGVRLATANFIPVVFHTLTDLIVDSMRDRLPGHGV